MLQGGLLSAEQGTRPYDAPFLLAAGERGRMEYVRPDRGRIPGRMDQLEDHEGKGR